MNKTILVLNVLALSINLAIGPTTATALETAPSLPSSQPLPSLAPMLEKVMPSVVSINVEGSTMVKNGTMSQPFQQFFGGNSPFCQEDSPFQDTPLCQNDRMSPRQSKKEEFKALGAGVVINAAKGYIVTNNHVVENANKIQVQLSDGRRYNAETVGRDPRTDIALLKLKNFNNLTAIKMADSSQLRVGDYTVAIGNPFGIGETATSGIVSALGRSGVNLENYENFIQTDAAINRGNSGGALVNLNGELIGMNTAILAPDGGNIGIGFAIPSNMIKNITTQIAESGKVKRGEIGIMGTELNAGLAKAMNLETQKGALISQVIANSSAAKAGIKAGDVVIKLNGKPINSFAAFRAEVSSLPIGTQVNLGLLRDGKSISIDVKLAESSRAQNAHDNIIYKRLEGAELSNAEGNKGIKVGKVEANSIAARFGLKENDIITEVNTEKRPNLEKLRKILDAAPPALALGIQRGESVIYLFISL